MKTFIPISEYMLRSTQDRRAHLELDSPCMEIGGGSQQFRGLLAHHLGTTISTKREAILCHACHNGNCSNPKHLYWGTYSDNLKDSYENGRETLTEAIVRIHGKDGLKAIRSKAGKSKTRR